MRLSWFLCVSAAYSARGISLTHATRRFVFAIIKCCRGSYAALPQFTPPTLPGACTVPCKLGGVKIPSLREAAILSWHHLASSGLGPQVSATLNCSGTSEIVEKGCVGELSSPAISDFGT